MLTGFPSEIHDNEPKIQQNGHDESVPIFKQLMFVRLSVQFRTERIFAMRYHPPLGIIVRTTVVFRHEAAVTFCHPALFWCFDRQFVCLFQSVTFAFDKSRAFYRLQHPADAVMIRINHDEMLFVYLLLEQQGFARITVEISKIVTIVLEKIRLHGWRRVISTYVRTGYVARRSFHARLHLSKRVENSFPQWKHCAIHYAHGDKWCGGIGGIP